jgi:lipopolysaccharide transport system permease protein
MRSFPTSPSEIFASFWRNRRLLTALVKRDVQGRYRGSQMGMFWSFLTPVLMLAIYTFVFSVVFKARWGSATETRTEFALVLFSGLIVFNIFAECLNRAPNLVVENPSYVKKVIFPLEILPLVSAGSALFHAAISFCVWLLFYIPLFGIPGWSALWLPVVLLPMILLSLGLSWFLSSLGVFLRDISQVVTVVTTGLMFLSPIFFPASALPEDFRLILQINPLTPTIEATRNILIFDQSPGWLPYAIHLFMSTMIFWFGFLWFQKTRKGFADVL